MNSGVVLYLSSYADFAMINVTFAVLQLSTFITQTWTFSRKAYLYLCTCSNVFTLQFSQYKIRQCKRTASSKICCCHFKSSLCMNE